MLNVKIKTWVMRLNELNSWERKRAFYIDLHVSERARKKSAKIYLQSDQMFLMRLRFFNVFSVKLLFSQSGALNHNINETYFGEEF